MTDDTATPEEGRLPTPHLGHGPRVITVTRVGRHRWRWTLEDCWVKWGNGYARTEEHALKKARRAKARLDQELTWNAAAKRYTS